MDATARRAPITLILVMLMTMAASHAASAGDPLTDSRLDPSILAEGTLRDAAGNPTAGQVFALAWPDDATLAALDTVSDAAGEFKMTPVAMAEVAADGAFRLRLATGVPLSPFLEPGASKPAINFTLLGQTANGFAVYPTFRAYGYNKAAPTLPVDVNDLVPLDAATVVDLQPGIGNSGEVSAESEETAGDGLGEDDPVAELISEVPSELPPVEPAVVDKVFICSGKLIRRYDVRKDLVGEAHTHGSSTANFTYLNGSSSRLGVGVSADGTYGSFHAEGSMSKSSSGKLTYPGAGNSRNKFYWTWFEPAKYKFRCSDVGWSMEWYEVRARTWAGGTFINNATNIPAKNYCARQDAHTAFHRVSSKTVTWTDGFKVGGAIGINLLSQTGYDTQTSIHYKFSRLSRICGNNDWPTKSFRISARSW